MKIIIIVIGHRLEKNKYPRIQSMNAMYLKMERDREQKKTKNGNCTYANSERTTNWSYIQGQGLKQIKEQMSVNCTNKFEKYHSSKIQR